MAGPRVTTCSGCLDLFEHNDLYEVYKVIREGKPDKGLYRSPRCEKCMKDKDSYHSISKEPKNKEIKPKKKKTTK